MSTPWIIGIVVATGFFIFFEWRAFKYPLRQDTLSRFVARIGANWPLSIWLMGLFAGILASHLFWPWCSNPLGPGAG